MTQNNLEIYPGWETVRKIGSGSYGAVYEIERDVFGKTEKAALKVLSIPRDMSEIEELAANGYDRSGITKHFESMLSDIVREYQFMADMKGSSNIVDCDDIRYIQKASGVGWDIYIKMELLTPLTRALEDPMTEEQVIKVGKDICKALILCEKRNIIHRDIKPQNIFVSKDGDYKLGDFGIAKTIKRTSGGTKAGTVSYMAPEINNNEPYGHAADLYSLGITLYWMLNERRIPFLPLQPEVPTAKEREEAVIRRFRGEPLPRPVNGSEALQNIILKACAFDPRERYHTAEEFLEDLNYYEHPGPRPSPKLVIGIILGILASVLAAGAWFLFVFRTPTSPLSVGPTSVLTPAPAVTPEPPPFDYRASAISLPMKNISSGSGHAVAIRQDGSVIANGDNRSNQCEVADWRDIVVVEAGDECTFGIRRNGYAVVVGNNTFGQFDKRWEYLTDISVSSNHVVGLREDGTVVALGKNENGECNTDSWQNIIAISAGGKHTVGLRADGTVVAVGENDDGQCNVSDWRDIIAISAGGLHTVALTADGYVLATGSKLTGACRVDDWSDMIAIDAGNTHTVGIKADGTAVAAGTTLMGECSVSEWTNLIAINAGGSITLGLQKDGKVLYTSSTVSTPWYGIKTTKEVPDRGLRTDTTSGEPVDGGVTWKYNESVKALVYSGNGAMRDYTIEEGIVLPWTKYESVAEVLDIKSGITSIGNCAFIGMTSFETGQGVKRVFIPKTVKRIGEAAFEFSFDLSDVYYEGTKEEWQQIDIEKNNSFLTEATLHCDSMEEDLFRLIETSIRWEFDEESRTLTLKGNGPMPEYGAGGVPWISIQSEVNTLVIEEGITSVSSWAFALSVRGIRQDGTFTSTDGLKTLVLPKSLKKIEDFAFYTCVYITDVYYAGSNAEWEKVAIGSDNEYVGNAAVHVGGEGEKDRFQTKVSSSSERSANEVKCVKTSAGWVFTAFLMSDGTVLSTKSDEYGQFSVSEWRDIEDISVGMLHILGLKKDGTVVATGRNKEGQRNVSDLSGIIQVATGANHSVFLKSDGTAFVRGSNENGQALIMDWKDLIFIASGWEHTLGLKADGTVLAVGHNGYGQCKVENWHKIIAIDGGSNHSVGLKGDGTVIAVGNNKFGQCDIGSWGDIIAISAGENHTVGLKADGTVLSTGDNKFGQCDTSGWKNIVSVSAGSRHTIGVDTNGNVFSAGNNENGQREDMTKKHS